MTILVGATPSGPTIDFSELGVSLTHRFNNPVIWLPTPVEKTATGATPPLIGSNVFGINIGFLQDTYTLSFTLTDGFGSNFTNGTKNYEKLVMMSRVVPPKKLIIDGSEIYVHVESFNVTFTGGGKDLALNCTANLRACKDI